MKAVAYTVYCMEQMDFICKFCCQKHCNNRCPSWTDMRTNLGPPIHCTMMAVRKQELFIGSWRKIKYGDHYVVAQHMCGEVCITGANYVSVHLAHIRQTLGLLPQNCATTQSTHHVQVVGVCYATVGFACTHNTTRSFTFYSKFGHVRHCVAKIDLLFAKTDYKKPIVYQPWTQFTICAFIAAGV